MTEITLDSLGLTPEKLQELVIDRLVERATTGLDWDEDGDEYTAPSAFSRELEKRVQERINARIQELFDAHVSGDIGKLIDSVTLQETTRWGEKRGEPLSFIEYLTARAENYLQEKVDYAGKSKGESGGYSWSGTQTRVAHMVHQHLHCRIEEAMKKAVKDANAVIVGGLEETVKIKLAEIQKKLSVTVKP